MKIKTRIKKIVFLYLLLSIFLMFYIFLVDTKEIVGAKSLLNSQSVDGVFISQFKHDIIMCKNEGACIHEVGHWVDKNLGFPSMSFDFKRETILFLEKCESIDNGIYGDDFCDFFYFPGIKNNPMYEAENFSWGGYSEFYATMYRMYMYEGYSLPEEFVEFYKEKGDWNG